jgi:ribonuclease HII
MIEFESEYWSQGELVIGVDEAGRGPMAGPLVVCGVVLPMHYHHPIINDSKKLTAKKRELCFFDILNDAHQIIVEIISPKEIDRLNIYRATQLAMERIINQANLPGLVDAMPVDCLTPTQSIIKGDQKSISIAAASIIAKVMRDKIMDGLDTQYPYYGFKQHKGYPTKAHKQAIEDYGRSIVHRKSFMFKDES